MDIELFGLDNNKEKNDNVVKPGRHRRLYVLAIGSAILFLAVVMGLVLFILHLSRKQDFFKKSVESSEYIIKKTQADVTALETEKKNFSEENTKLKTSLQQSLLLGTQLKGDNVKLNAKIKNYEKIIKKEKAANNNLTKQVTDGADKLEYSAEIDKKYKSLLKAANNFRKKSSVLEQILKKERALYHYNLGVAYVRAKMIPQARKAFSSSLDIDPNNFDAHYNLGFLCSQDPESVEEAIAHYRSYLALKTDAQDKQAVEEKINNLILKLGGGFQ